MKDPTDAEILGLALKHLLSPEDRDEILQDATVLLGSIHEWNWKQAPGRKIMFGKAMALETLYALGKFLNEEFPEE